MGNGVYSTRDTMYPLESAHIENTYYLLADGVYSTKETTSPLESVHMENTYT